ncbi:MAG: TrmB family transcriptional regulator [Halohasta sp.]
MDAEELIETLEDAGLSPYQADAFVTLLGRGSASATEIAKASSVPDARIYDVLRGLDDAGYIEIYQQDSLHARAHDPADVLADLRSRANRFEVAAEEIEDRWDQPDIEEHQLSILKRLDTVLAQAEGLIREAETQVHVGVTVDQYYELEAALACALDRGADVKVCLVPSIDEEIDLPSQESLARTSTEVRKRSVPSPFVALIDRSWTCFSPHGHSTNEYGVMVNDMTHTYVFYWYFLTNLWEGQETVYSARNEAFPITYVDIRHCLRRIVPLVEGGKEVEAVVDGIDTETGREVSLRGTITDVTYAGENRDETYPTALSDLAGEASFRLETDDGTYTVGGWGAMIEEVEAIEITIEGTVD